MKALDNGVWNCFCVCGCWRFREKLGALWSCPVLEHCCLPAAAALGPRASDARAKDLLRSEESNDSRKSTGFLRPFSTTTCPGPEKAKRATSTAL